MVIQDFDFQVWFLNPHNRSQLPTLALLVDTTFTEHDRGPSAHSCHHGVTTAWPESCTRASQVSQMSPMMVLKVKVIGGIGGVSLLPFSSFASLPSRTFWNRKTPPFHLRPSMKLLSSTWPSKASLMLSGRWRLYPDALDFHSFWLYFSCHKQKANMRLECKK